MSARAVYCQFTKTKGDEQMARHMGYDEIRLDEIRAEGNIRDSSEPDDALIASVREHGVIEPVIVRIGDDGYELVAGFRRLAAARVVGLETIPARVMDLTDRQYREFQLLENELRQELDPLERARALKGLIEEHGLTQQQVGALLGKSQEWVSNQLRLLEAPEGVQESIRRGILSPSAALETLKVKDAPEIVAELEGYLGKATQPLTVADVRAEVVNAVYKKGRHLNESRIDTAGCRGCDKKVNAYGLYYCADVACVKRKEAEFAAAQREAVQAARAGEVPVLGWEAAPSVLSTCPEDCPDRAMVRRMAKDPPAPACLKPDSECRRAKISEQNTADRARWAEESAEREARAKAEVEARQTHLRRVERYLAHRVASNQKAFSRPEMRLACLVLLGDWAGSEYAAGVLGLSEEDDLEARLLTLSTRELTTLAVGFLLTQDQHLSTGYDFNAVRDSIVGQAELPEPEDTLQFDPARLVNPEAGAECDGDCDKCDREQCVRDGPEPADVADEDGDDPAEYGLTESEARGDAPGEDGTYESYEAIQPAGTGEGEGETPEDTPPAQCGPQPHIDVCPVTQETTTAEECLACCARAHAEDGLCCQAVTRGEAPFRCPGTGECPTVEELLAAGGGRR